MILRSTKQQITNNLKKLIDPILLLKFKRDLSSKITSKPSKYHFISVKATPKKNIHPLCLSVIYQGIGLPILWTILRNKRDNSSEDDRIKLFDRFHHLF